MRMCSLVISMLVTLSPMIAFAEDIPPQQANVDPQMNLPQDPVDPSSELLKKGQAFMDGGKYEEAINEFSEIIKKNPSLSRAYLDRALSYSYAGKLDLAIADFNKAIEVDPNSADAYGGRAVFYVQQNKLTDALADWNKAAEISPKDPDVYRMRANTYLLTHDYDNAWADVHKAEDLGAAVSLKFIRALKEASGRDQ